VPVLDAAAAGVNSCAAPFVLVRRTIFFALIG